MRTASPVRSAPSGVSWDVATAIVLAVGVTGQFTQHTDPTFPLRYYTVDSALLAVVAITAGAAGVRTPASRALRLTALVAVVLSGVVFAGGIAPVRGGGSWFAPHDDLWVRAATVALHGIAPVLVVAACASPQRGHPRLRRRTGIIAVLAWPAAYGVGLALAVGAGLGPVPYEFLDPHRVGAGGLFVVSAALGAASVAIGIGLTALERRRG